MNAPIIFINIFLVYELERIIDIGYRESQPVRPQYTNIVFFLDL